jgi:hypothetical protein
VTDDVVDWSLLDGFEYGCRPGCGICCYTTPRVTAAESTRLIQIAPATRIVGDADGERWIESRPDGGACALLRETRCSAHSARPSPCRRFPIAVHGGARLQATLVLSCPGVSLSTLARRTRTDPVGLAEELAAVREFLAEPSTGAEVERARRSRERISRRMTREGRWKGEDEVRAVLRNYRVDVARGYPLEALPSRADGLEFWPLYFSDSEGCVALGEGEAGWEAVALRESGGVRRRLGEFLVPERPPALEERAEQLLQAYLRYVLARDQLFGAVAVEISDAELTLEAAVAGELDRVGAQVLARAAVRQMAESAGSGRLTVADVERGIRATDMDLLDRPSWGALG